MKGDKKKAPVLIEEFEGFKHNGYSYRRTRARKDGIVRVCGFAGCSPEAWKFIVHHRRGEAPLFAIMHDQGDGEEVLMLVRASNGRFTSEGRELCWKLMPAAVQDAVLAFGGKRP